MPKMRGDQMQDRLLKNPEFRLTPIIFLSAVADKSLIMKGKEKGAIVTSTSLSMKKNLWSMSNILS